MMTTPAHRSPGLDVLLTKLKLPTFLAVHGDAARQAAAEDWGFDQYLRHLCELEIEERHRRRIARNLKRSGLPSTKTLATLDVKRLPAKVARVLPSLCEGGYLERGENVLAFGSPGTGKSHVVSAIGHELVHKGYEVLYTPTFRLVQRLLVAKRELTLEAVLKRLDRFDVIALDDIGYVQQDREEMEVLFTLLSERYERRSVMITSNLVFSQWDKIFKDPMTTAAAVDRVVHHATILELTGPSYRAEQAKSRNPNGKLKKSDKEV
jgi:DNA replication protein DnaC